MTDKMETLTALMEQIEALEKIRDLHAKIAANPTDIPLREIMELCDATAKYFSGQIDMLRNLLGDKDLFYDTFNRLNYLTTE
jgi:hypothetical protein